MQHPNLSLLTEVLPAGTWFLQTLESGKVDVCVLHLDGSTETIAQALNRELAEFLLAARSVLPSALKELDEERAYHALLQQDYASLSAHVQSLHTELVSHEIDTALSQNLLPDLARERTASVTLTSARRPLPPVCL